MIPAMTKRLMPRMSIKGRVYALILMLALVASGAGGVLLWQNQSHGVMTEHLNDFHLRAVGHAQNIGKHASLVEKYSLWLERGVTAEKHGYLLRERRASLFTIEKSFASLVAVQKRYGPDKYNTVTRKAFRQLNALKGDAKNSFDWGDGPALEMMTRLQALEVSVEQIERIHQGDYDDIAGSMGTHQDNNIIRAGIILLPLLVIGILMTISIIRSINQSLEAQRATTRALRESENQHRNLIEVSPDGIFVMITGLIVYANQKGAELCGATEVNQILGLSSLEFVHPDDREMVQIHRQSVADDVDVIHRLTFRRIRLDGSELIAEGSTAIVTWQGEPAQLLLVRDVTERKRIDDELQRSQDLLTDALHAVPVGFVLYDPDERLLMSNGKCSPPGLRQSISPGTSVEDILKRTAESGRVPAANEDTQQWIDRQLAYFRNPEGSIEIEYIDGTVHQITGRKTAEGGTVTIRDDITKLRRNEREIQHSQEHLQTLLDHIIDGIITIDEFGVMETVNPAAAWIFGYEEDEMIGENISILMNDPDRSQHDGFLDAYRQTGQARMTKIAARQVLGRRKQGDSVPLEVSIVEMVVGGKRKFIGTMHDVTERLRAEQEIHRINGELEERVVLRTQQFESSNTELKATLESLQQTQEQLVQSEKLSALGGLVAGVAHEINTPIGIGITAASHLDDQTETLESLYKENKITRAHIEKFIESGRQSSQIILTNLNRASDLIRSFKQVAVDQSTEDKRTFNLRSYTDEILLSLRPKLKQARHDVTIEGGEAIDVDSYPGAYSQVVTNLVMNALIHAFEEGEVGSLRISFEESNGRVTMIFADDGKGIPADHLPKIFDPFFTTRRGSGGTGLGLNIISNIISQRLGGSIKCDSEIGEGTTFRIEFPCNGPKHVNTETDKAA
jgi:PAS domain S-box-containing protein